MSEFPSEWIVVWLRSGGSLHVPVSALQELDPAYTKWVEKEQDSVLNLTTIPGEQSTIPASLIDGWIIMNDKTQERAWRYEVWREERTKKHQRDAGYVPEDERNEFNS